MHTIDPKMLMAWGDVLAFGAKKYHQRNFLKAPGMAWSRVYDSLQRHLLAFWAGEWLDGESGLPHLAHVMCNLQFLWTYHEHERYKAGDDRPSSIEYAGLTYEDWEKLFKAASSDDPAVKAEAFKDGVFNFFGALANASGHKTGRKPDPNKGTRGFTETGTMQRVEDLLYFCKEGGRVDCTLDVRDIQNLVNMAKGE